MKKPEQIGHLQRHRAVGTADHSEDRPRAGSLFHPGRRPVSALEHADVDVGQGRPDKVQALVERVSVAAARVENVHP